jgi:hypothetical protein
MFAEEPLPLVRAHALFVPDVVLPSEPLREDAAIATVAYTETISTPARALETLRDAINTNDYPRFRAALAQASDLVDQMPLGAARNAVRRNVMIYRDVEQLWNFARTDRFGAFFDDESMPGLRDHLAADYRGLESFLAANRIIDNHGVELYPTSETRQYLLRLIDSAPRRDTSPVLIASTSSKRAKATTHRVAHHAPRVTIPHRAVAPTISAAIVAAPVATIVPALPIATPRTDAFAMPEQAVVLPKRTAIADAAPSQVVPSQSTGRGIFFVILALVLLGGLMTMLRTPEAAPTIVPAPEEKPAQKTNARRDDDVVRMKKAQ